MRGAPQKPIVGPAIMHGSNRIRNSWEIKKIIRPGREELWKERRLTGWLAGWLARRMENEVPSRPQWRVPHNGSQFKVVRNPWNLNYILYLFRNAYILNRLLPASLETV